MQEPSTKPEDLEKLYIAAHTLAGTSASYGFPQFSEVAAKMAHIFHYAMNATLTPDMHGPLTEFLSDAISVLEFDLLQISSNGIETERRHRRVQAALRFCISGCAGPPKRRLESEIDSVGFGEPIPEVFSAPSLAQHLPEDAEVPDEVLEFFIPEAEEHLQAVTECLLALEGNPNADDIHRLFRSIHTVKGSAAQVGLHRLSAVAHRVEDLIGHLRDGVLQPSAEIVDLCLQSVDVLRKFLTRQWSSDAEMAAAVDPLLARIGELAPEEVDEEATETQVTAPAAQGSAVESAAPIAASRPAGAQPLPQAKSVRISLERLDRMMNAVGELVINRTRMLGRLSELGKLVEVLTFSKSRLAGKVSEFQEKHEFTRIASDPCAGQPGAANGYVSASPRPARADHVQRSPRVQRTRDGSLRRRQYPLALAYGNFGRRLGSPHAARNFMGRVDTDIDEFTKLAHHLQDEITAARMVPIGNLYTRLSRTVRDAAQSTGKPVDLALEGAETELDNNIIQHISDPLIHLVRNAVAHGIEDPETRRRAGKSEKGRISVRAYHRGNHIFIEVEDDGRGIDYERVRQGVIDSGAVSPVAAAELTERELREFLFRPGFSTASSTSELAGRGVGLDVVRSNVHALNGEIEVRSEKGQGACFTVKVPLTLIISQALFVRCGTSVFALPLAVVEEIRRLRPAEIEDVGGKLLTRVRDVVTEVVRLDLQLALPPLEPLNGYFHMVIVKGRGQTCGRGRRRSARQGRNRHQESRRLSTQGEALSRHDNRVGWQPDSADRFEPPGRGGYGRAPRAPGIVSSGARFRARRGGSSCGQHSFRSGRCN